MSSHSRQSSISTIESQACQNHPKKIGPWKLGKTLGRGATGRVLLATHQSTGQKAAVKVVSKSELQYDQDLPHAEEEKTTQGLPYGIEREIIIMKLLNHPNVLRLYDVWETSKALYLVLEYVEGGELFDLLVERGPLQELEAIKYFRQIILGTAYCHALGICHRDLKPENLLLDGQLNVKLADFGMAALESNGKLLETSCGSPHYAAPEIVSGFKYHGAASDVWSCGVILFALLTGRLPFDDDNIRNLLLKVQAGKFEMPTDISPEAQDLIARMLTADPSQRIKTDRILKHPLLAKYPIPNEDLISEKSLPHPATAYKSLGSVRNIDKQILSNLSILWQNRSEQEIIDCLLKNGSNPEKTFYALLMRYKHNQGDPHSPGKSNTTHSKIPRSESATITPRRAKRGSKMVASRPTSFQYKNAGGNRNSVIGRMAHDHNSSVQNTPRKSPHKNQYRSPRKSPVKSPYKSPYRSPYKSPRKSPQKKYLAYNQSPVKSIHRNSAQNQDPTGVVPRNLYNEIVQAQSTYSIPPSIPSTLPLSVAPSIPSKSSYYQRHESVDAPKQENASAPSGDLMQSAKISPGKRSSVMAKKRMSRRKSLRVSMTTGLKRNSITMKLLSTYAKLAGDSEWEYMDKQAKRTSETFATLCDKIFNEEEYDEDDENLVDLEEKEAREYERLMEIERKKHEAELKARRELEKRKKRQLRRSLLSSRKLSILVKQDTTSPDEPNNCEVEIVDKEIIQHRRQSKNISALRSLSEGNPKENRQEFDLEEIENLKTRSATQPTHRRTTPVLTKRRPVSKLDPLWQAYENEELEKAKDALEAEWRSAQLQKQEQQRQHKRQSQATIVRKKINRESMISVMDDIQPIDHNKTKRHSLVSYHLGTPQVGGEDLTDEYMSEIRKSRLLNSQYNLQGKKLSHSESGPKTLIGNVNIPNVTRKSRNFTNSNKRLSVLSMYSTKESYHDLSSYINSREEQEREQQQEHMPNMRTSLADRLNHAGTHNHDYDEDDLFDSSDKGSVIDFEEHVASKRFSYYDEADRQVSRGTTRQYTKPTGSRPVSKIPDLPSNEAIQEDTFISQSDEIHRQRRRKSMLSYETTEDDSDVFDKIKLPEGKSTKSSIDALANGTSANGHKSVKSMLPDHEEYKSNLNAYVQDKKPILYPKVRDQKSNGDQILGKKPLEDKTNVDHKRKPSFFRKLSWGSKKTMESAVDRSTPSPTEEKPKSSFFRWFSSSSSTPLDSELRKFNTILPRPEMSTALFALLDSWANFGLKDLRNDQVGYNITGSVSKHNAFQLKGCKFRIKINTRSMNQKSEIVCVRTKGSRATTDTLFAEIEKVLRKEGVLDV